MGKSDSVLTRLMEVILSRKLQRPDESYTTRLFDGGLETIAAKVTEEAEELARAAEGQVSTEVIHEAADLLYHMLVLLAHCEVGLEDVEEELARRFGTSGLDEKASRKK